MYKKSINTEIKMYNISYALIVLREHGCSTVHSTVTFQPCIWQGWTRHALIKPHQTTDLVQRVFVLLIVESLFFRLRFL